MKLNFEKSCEFLKRIQTSIEIFEANWLSILLLNFIRPNLTISSFDQFNVVLQFYIWIDLLSWRWIFTSFLLENLFKRLVFCETLLDSFIQFWLFPIYIFDGISLLRPLSSFLHYLSPCFHLSKFTFILGTTFITAYSSRKSLHSSIGSFTVQLFCVFVQITVNSKSSVQYFPKRLCWLSIKRYVELISRTLRLDFFTLITQ